MSAQREMTLQEWVDKLPGIHSAHKEFDSLQATIAQQAERIAQVETQRDNYFAINIELNQDVSNQCEQLFKQSAEIERLTSECDTGQRRAEMAQRLHEDHYSTIAQQAERIAEMEAEAAENCRIVGMSGEREARHLAAISELERECNGLAARIGKELNVENEALKVSVSEQAALIEKCERALRLVQKYAPITLDCEAFHHPKSMQHDSESTCEPAARYYHALNEVGKIIAAIANQKGGAA